MTTMNVLDSVGATIAIEKPLTPGRAADSASRPVALSNEDVAILGIITETAPASDTASSGLNGRLQRLAQNITSLITGGTPSNASAVTGGIASAARLPSAAASTNATNVKTSAGRIYSASGKNNAAYDIFLVLYDSATNPPVPGTTTIRKKIVCPANQAFVYDWPVGLSFAAGIGYAFTKLVADADTTVLVAADITAFNLDYV